MEHKACGSVHRVAFSLFMAHMGNPPKKRGPRVGILYYLQNIESEPLLEKGFVFATWMIMILTTMKILPFCFLR